MRQEGNKKEEGRERKRAGNVVMVVGKGREREGEERDVRGSNVGPEREQKRRDGVGRQ